MRYLSIILIIIISCDPTGSPVPTPDKRIPECGYKIDGVPFYFTPQRMDRTKDYFPRSHCSILTTADECYLRLFTQSWKTNEADTIFYLFIQLKKRFTLGANISADNFLYVYGQTVDIKFFETKGDISKMERFKINITGLDFINNDTVLINQEYTPIKKYYVSGNFELLNIEEISDSSKKHSITDGFFKDVEYFEIFLQ